MVCFCVCHIYGVFLFCLHRLFINVWQRAPNPPFYTNDCTPLKKNKYCASSQTLSYQMRICMQHDFVGRSYTTHSGSYEAQELQLHIMTAPTLERPTLVNKDPIYVQVEYERHC